METLKSCKNCVHGGPEADDTCISCRGMSHYEERPMFFAKKLTPAEYIAKIQETVPEKGVKFDSDKPKWSLMPRGVLTQAVEVMTIGAKKYSPDNWMYVEPSRYYDALNRHVDAWRNGQRLDEETGKHHLAHALCCLIFMLWHDDHKDQTL